jgi:hypothetical protein
VNILSDNPIFILFLTAIVFLTTWNFYLHLQFYKNRKKLKIFFAGKSASDLEGVLFEEIKRLKKSEDEIKNILKSLKGLEKKASLGIQKVGMIRFNPFKEVGSDQSFAIALVDFHDNGLVISGLYTREGTRVYAKPVEAGQSKYTLTKEEKEALKKAGIK